MSHNTQPLFVVSSRKQWQKSNDISHFAKQLTVKMSSNIIITIVYSSQGTEKTNKKYLVLLLFGLKRICIYKHFLKIIKLYCWRKMISFDHSKFSSSGLDRNLRFLSACSNSFHLTNKAVMRPNKYLFDVIRRKRLRWWPNWDATFVNSLSGMSMSCKIAIVFKAVAMSNT